MMQITAKIPCLSSVRVGFSHAIIGLCLTIPLFHMVSAAQVPGKTPAQRETSTASTSNCDIVPVSQTVKVGDLFKMVLPTTPATGYTWLIRALPPQVALTGMEYVSSPECKKGKVGCGGTTLLHLKAITAGKGKLLLQYARPWEPLPNDMQVSEVRVIEP
ncbi:MAG: protease inhibitor I42 family protein [Serratia sp. (in: enterobacteria)]|uniref:protease inhibitor I42 family protein n=1 Tax=Serratia sp. (in: enterobacteria) TaxID=616 RepID=UPI003F2D6CA7